MGSELVKGSRVQQVWVGLERICISNRLPGADPTATLGESTTLSSSRSRMFAQRKHMLFKECPVALALCMRLLNCLRSPRPAGNRGSHYAHVADESTEAHRGQITQPRSHRLQSLHS